MSKDDPIRTGVYHRDGQVIQTEKCEIPVCNNFQPPESQNGVCAECEIFAQKMIWILDKITSGPPPDPADQKGTFFVPKPGMANAAIKEALQARGTLS